MWRNARVHKDPSPPSAVYVLTPCSRHTLLPLQCLFTVLALPAAEDVTSTTVDEVLSFLKTAHGEQGPHALSCLRGASARQITDVLTQRNESPPAQLAQLMMEEPAKEAVVQGDGAGEAV